MPCPLGLRLDMNNSIAALQPEAVSLVIQIDVRAGDLKSKVRAKGYHLPGYQASILP